MSAHRWGKRDAPQIGQVWELTGRHAGLWLILEDVRWGHVEWDFDAFSLETGERYTLNVNEVKAHNLWTRVT